MDKTCAGCGKAIYDKYRYCYECHRAFIDEDRRIPVDPGNLLMEKYVAEYWGKLRGHKIWMKYKSDDEDPTPDYLYYRGTLGDPHNPLLYFECAEFKRRYIKFGVFKDYMLNKSKVDKLLSYDKLGILVVACDDQMGWLRPAVNPPYREAMGGRGTPDNPSRNPSDRQIQYYFRWEDFTIIGSREQHYPLIKPSVDENGTLTKPLVF